jgi:tetratricopeptide (TPR) repeat protein/tRNA A-37 threonylcarbamoyl transferase component Bud32
MATIDLADAERESRLNNILAAYFDAFEQGHVEDREALLARHPDLAADLAAFFDEQEQMAGLASPLLALLQAQQWPAPHAALASSGEAPADSSSLAASPIPFGEYELLEQIGDGGMGVVYKARQRKLNRLVALKLIRAGALAAADDLRRFCNEAEAAATLDHPSIVPVHEVGEHAGHPYFSMRLIEGGSLDRQLARYSTDPKAAARLVATVARAVHHAHQRGILHRDIKPSNILLDRDGQPHITDFGLAKRVEVDSGLTQSGVLVGTPSYMAPEQASCARTAITTATDVYGLGALLYTLLCGRPPFRGDTVLETLEQVKAREPELPSASNPRIDRELQTICLKCLEKEPDRRYSSAQALADDLERWLRGEAVEAGPPSALYRIRKFAWRNRVALATTSLVALALVAGTTVSVWQAIVARRARADALAQRDRARQAEADAVTQRDRARQAVNDMYTQFAEKWLSQQPRLETVQREFLLKALAFYEESTRKEDPSPVDQQQAAKSYFRIGDIQQRLGKPAEAEAAYRAGIDLLSRLVARFPGKPQCRDDLAGGCSNLAVFLLRSGRTEQGEALLRRAIALLEGLAAENADGTQYFHRLARVYANLGAMLEQAGRPREAQAPLRQAIDVARKRRAASPTDPLARKALALGHLNLAECLQQTDGPAAGEPDRREAIALYEGLLAESPTNPEYRENLAHILSQRGYALFLMDRFGESEQAHRRAVDHSERLVADFPMVPNYPDLLARSRCGLAYVLANRRDVVNRDAAQAVRLAEKAVGQLPKESSVWGTLATVRYRAGDWKGAIAAKEKTIELAKAADAQDWLILAMSRWQLGDKGRAHADFGRALAWMRENSTKDDELCRLRAEAAALLGVTDNPKSAGKKQDENPTRRSKS